MYDYFAAPSDEVAASMIDGGPVAAGHRAVETKWLDPAVVMGKLEELLTGRPYDEVVDDPRCAADLAVVLRELKELAVDAVKGGERLYCWVCV